MTRLQRYARISPVQSQHNYSAVLAVIVWHVLIYDTVRLVVSQGEKTGINRVFFRLAALFVVDIARYDSSSRLASRKNPSISFLPFHLD